MGIKILFIILLAGLGLVATPVLGQDCIIGDTAGSAGDYWEVTDEIFASKFTASCTGTIDSARVFMYNFNATVDWQSYVYSYPAMSLLASSDVTAIGAKTGAWSDWMVFSSPTTVDSGDVVLLAISSEGNIIDRVYYTNAANDTTFRDLHVCCGSPPSTLAPTDTVTSYHLQMHGYMTESAAAAGDIHSGDKHGSTLH